MAVSKYVDNSKVVADIIDKDGIISTQDSLDIIYEWMVTNNMMWNKNKFQMLKLGRNMDLKLDTVYFSRNMDGVFDVKDHLKDLGIYMDKLN